MYISKLNVNLYSWQETGVKWMINKESNDNCGGLLCDDMGLGKTVQVMSLLALKPIKTLIIVPPILVNQWLEWIKKIETPYYYYHTKPLTREDWLKTLSILQSAQIVITTYQKILNSKSKKSQIKDICSPVQKITWSRIVVDECHYLQSDKSLRTQAVLKLKGTYCWGVTGTPFEKSPTQMRSLLKFVKWDGDFKSKSNLKSILMGRKISEISELAEKLPTLTDYFHNIDFPRDEANFYYSLCGDIRKEWLRQKNLRLPHWVLSRNYLILTSFLQLATLHPQLVFDKIGDWIRSGKYFEEDQDVIDQQLLQHFF